MSSSRFDIATCAVALVDDAFLLQARPECDSTNTQLMLLAEAGAPSGTVLVTDSQTAGRGRRGRAWISSTADSLTFSLLWRFPPHSAAPEALSLVVGLGLQRALTSLGAPTELKWPNDILHQDKKLAGVLVEVQAGDIKSAVIGVGINLALPGGLPADVAATATALDDILTPLPTREYLLAVLLKELGAVLRRYEHEGFAGLREGWQARHAFQGRPVRLSGGAEDLEGVCNGVTERGELLINTAQGVRRIVSGDVSLRLT